MLDIFYDPQTSGGLLISVDKNDADKCLDELVKNNVDAFIVGKVVEEKDKPLYIK